MKLHKRIRLLPFLALTALFAPAMHAQERPLKAETLPLTSALEMMCPDSSLRLAEISGNELSVLLWTNGAVAGRKAQLFSGKKLIWSGVTDQQGRFLIRKLTDGSYTLYVERWGSATIRLDPKYAGPFAQVGQTPHFDVQLSNFGCVSVGISMD